MVWGKWTFLREKNVSNSYVMIKLTLSVLYFWSFEIRHIKLNLCKNIQNTFLAEFCISMRFLRYILYDRKNVSNILITFLWTLYTLYYLSFEIRCIKLNLEGKGDKNTLLGEFYISMWFLRYILYFLWIFVTSYCSW